jgi:phosphomannomutase
MAKDRIAPHIFRAYDIRGLSQGGDDDEITTDTARAIGRAMAAYLRELPSAVGRMGQSPDL